MQKEERANHGGNHGTNTTKAKNKEEIFICMSHLWLEWHKMTDCPKFAKMQKMFHGKSMIVTKVQPVAET